MTGSSTIEMERCERGSTRIPDQAGPGVISRWVIFRRVLFLLPDSSASIFGFTCLRGVMLPIALGILAVAGLIAAVWFWDRMTGDWASDSARGTEARVYAGWANGTRPAREHAELAITWGPTAWGGVFIDFGDAERVQPR